MVRIPERIGPIPYVAIGAGLLLVGLLSVGHVVNNFWPIDVVRLDLVRGAALDRSEATSLLQASNQEYIVAFLASLLVATTGLTLPILYLVNRRIFRQRKAEITTVLRQAMWVGVWVAFCVWLQMNRSLGWGVAILVGAVLFILEVFLQVRNRAAEVTG